MQSAPKHSRNRELGTVSEWKMIPWGSEHNPGDWLGTEVFPNRSILSQDPEKQLQFSEPNARGLCFNVGAKSLEFFLRGLCTWKLSDQVEGEMKKREASSAERCFIKTKRKQLNRSKRYFQKWKYMFMLHSVSEAAWREKTTKEQLYRKVWTSAYIGKLDHNVEKSCKKEVPDKKTQISKSCKQKSKRKRDLR